MPWARLDDRINNDAKLLALTDPAHRMWTCGLAYCQFNLTDGFVPDHAIHAFGVRAKNKEGVASELCAVQVVGKKPLWRKVDNGYQFNDYLHWNDSRDKVIAERAQSKERLDRHKQRRQNGVGNTVHNALHAPHGWGSEHQSTYHVPRTEEKQELAHGASRSALDDVGIRMLRRQRSRETADGKPAIRVIVALARHIIAASPDIDEGELMERVKQACARANLEYSGASGEAIDRARAQLARKRSRAA